MNLLITGASGFIGNVFLNTLEKKSVVSKEEIILLTSKYVNGYKCVLHKNYSFTKEDFTENGISYIDTVIHMGAFIPKSSQDINNYYLNTLNIENTKWLISNLPTPPKKFIFISTIDVYDYCNLGEISEDTQTNPSTLYGHSKLYCEKMLKDWAKQNNVDLQILRLGHIYGPGEEVYKKLIPITICKVLKDESPTLYTTGKEHRSFLHIDDCCNSLAKCIVSKDVELLNIVSGYSFSVEEIIYKIIKLCGKNFDLIRNKNPEVGRNVVFNNSNMVTFLNIKEKPFDEGLLEEIQYFIRRGI